MGLGKVSQKMGLVVLATLLASLLWGCTCPRHRSLDGVYRAAIKDAAVVEEDERLELIPVAGEKVRVVTWVDGRYVGSYRDKAEVELSWGDVWVTQEPEVKDRCRTFERETLSSRVRQLLGLPAGEGERFFVVLEADAADMFRPCADPDISTTRCPKFTGADFASPEHSRFYSAQTATSYREGGYPWTRLGYTYDWNPETGDYGASEYVIRQGARVRVLGIYATDAYCGQ